jgi:ketosteroid isomerase-like protein
MPFRLDYSWSLDGGSTHRDWGKGVHVYRRRESGSWKLIMDVWNSDGPDSKITGDGS